MVRCGFGLIVNTGSLCAVWLSGCPDLFVAVCGYGCLDLRGVVGLLCGVAGLLLIVFVFVFCFGCVVWLRLVVVIVCVMDLLCLWIWICIGLVICGDLWVMWVLVVFYWFVVGLYDLRCDLFVMV